MTPVEKMRNYYNKLSTPAIEMVLTGLIGKKTKWENKKIIFAMGFAELNRRGQKNIIRNIYRELLLSQYANKVIELTSAELNK